MICATPTGSTRRSRALHLYEAPESVRGEGEEGVVTFASGYGNTASGKQHRVCRTCARPIWKPSADTAPRRRRPGAMELRRRGPIGLCKILRGSASHRYASACRITTPPAPRTGTRRLHRQLETSSRRCRVPPGVRDVRLALGGCAIKATSGSAARHQPRVCLSFSRRPRTVVRAQALNHVSRISATWCGGMSTSTCARASRVTSTPISFASWAAITVVVRRPTARQEHLRCTQVRLTFPGDLSLQLIKEIKRRGYSRTWGVACGHYSTAPHRSSISTPGISENSCAKL